MSRGFTEVPIDRAKQGLLRCFLFALWLACGTTVARAHATLLQTDPPPNSRLDRVPTTVRLSFNERIEAVFNSLEVLDQEGRRVDNGSPRVVGEGDVLEVGLKRLSNGPYTVVWRVNSVDGHQIEGRFGFGVQSDSPSERQMSNIPVPQSGLFWTLYAPIVKWAGLTGMVIWLGGISFWWTVFTPSIPQDWRASDAVNALVQAASRRTRKIIWSGAVTFYAAQLLALVGQGATLAHLPMLQALSPSAFRTTLVMTSYGRWWSVRMLAGLGVLALCCWKMRPIALSSDSAVSLTRATLPFGIGSGIFGGLMMLTIPMSGHARAVQGATALAVGIDWAHIAGTTIWIGGLVFLWAIVLLLQKKQTEHIAFLSRLASRFSQMARMCVLVLLATGIYTAWVHMSGWHAFVNTDYGRALLGKLILVTLMLLLAAVNLRGVLPALARYSQAPKIAHEWAGRFPKLIGAETALGGAVLVGVAILTSLPPATAVASVGPVRFTQKTQDMRVTLSLDSNKLGPTHAFVTLQDSLGGPVKDAKRVTIYARMLEMDMGLDTIQAKVTPTGAYEADVALKMAGRWTISVEVSPAHGDTFVSEFEISEAP